MKREAKTRIILLNRIFSEILSLLLFRMKVRINKSRERIPNTIPAKKGKKPVPGAWKLPMPNLYDSIHMKIEKMSQKELLHLSDISTPFSSYFSHLAVNPLQSVSL